MAKERITGSMNGMQMVMVMAGGNPGALRVVMELMTKGGDIDPDSALGGMGAVLGLDSDGIYEDKIRMFYKDICGESLSRMVGVQRAIQLGILDSRIITDALKQTYARVDENILDEAIKKVRVQLPNFKG